MDITIEPAVRADAETLAGILTEANQYKLAHSDNAWGTGDFTVEEVLDYIARHPTYTVRLDGQPVATASLQWADTRVWGDRPADAGYLHRLAVKASAHGLGIGQQIVDWAIAEVTTHHRQFLRLDCAVDNSKLCAYYESLGFVHVETKSIVEYQQYTAALYERSVAK